LIIKYLIFTFITLTFFSFSAYGESENELAGIKLGSSFDMVTNILGECKEQNVIVTPWNGVAYNFFIYKSSGILIVIKENQVIFVNITSPCKAKTFKGLAIGDKLSKAKELYGKGVKQSLGSKTQFIFPEYNLSVKGKKGTTVITDISIGKVKIY
jgi:hypothetical protein